ncbi:serine/arginine-rich splicing factor 2-like [Eurytemora carolleeae]|uniref:serine/arginine-rich splicing factor 2-like n=1 Tax=Eurytemora carolleeae TaxID=1294199 RepID=UPI000C773DDA|nr:serine/arginine-rich splicing factor 2-like [Eurytemora carolleeae]|eukprot:XP_023332010.1 serine/arginine-rich splicing factor 2-like [Eurytemora affinis]
MAYRKRPQDLDKMTSLRVGNLPFKATGEDLRPLFEKYGDVGDVFLPTERETGRSRGFAFVRYYEKRDAEDAIDALDGRTYDGRDLRISIDTGRPAGYGNNRGGRDGGRDGYRGGYRGGNRDGDRRRRSRSGDRSRGGGRRDRSRSLSRARGKGRANRDSRSRSRS